MAGIYGRIVTVGLPTIASQLNAGADEVIWVTQSFLISGIVIMLLFGRLGDLFGRVKLYEMGLIIFTVGSALSSLAPSAILLIAARAVQGVGGGILVVVSSAIITDASPRAKLGTMLGINQMAHRMGNVLGLTLSGVIISLLDWRGLFYFIVPVGVFATFWAHRRLKEDAVTDPVKKIDWLNLGLFSAGLLLVMLAITFLSYGISGYTEGFELMLAGSALLVFFVVGSMRSQYPSLDMRLMRIRAFAAGNTAQLLNSLTWGGMILLVAFYLQIGLGYPPLQAGLALLPLDLTYMISTLIGGRLSDRFQPRILTTLGLSLISLSFLLLSANSGTGNYETIALVLLVGGVGNGLFTPPNLKAIMGSVPLDRIGVASSFRNIMFSVGTTASYGLVILFIGFGIPYGTFSALLQTVGSNPTATSASTLEFFNGFRIAALLFALINGAAVIPSAIRGKSEERVEAVIPLAHPSE